MTAPSTPGGEQDLALLTALSVFRQSPAKVLASGLPGRRVLRELVAGMGGGDAVVPAGWDSPGPVPFCFALARALGLLAEDGGHLRVDGVRATAYFLASAADRTRQRVRAFRGVTAWTELCDLEGLVVDSGSRARAHGAPDAGTAARARATVFDAVAHLPPGAWTPAAEVVAGLQETAPELLFPAETGPYYPGIARPEGALTRLARAGGWHVVEGAFVRRCLRTLADLGAVERDDGDAGEEGGAGLRYRATEAGLYALGTGPRPEPPPDVGGELVVQPTFEVVVLASRADVSLVYTLERFATRTGPGPGTTYRIEEAGVYRAVREGMEVAEIHEFLEAHAAGRDLPSGVRFALQDWARRQDRIRVHRRAALVEFADAEALDAHLVAMDLDGAGARRVGDRWVLVPDSDRRAVTRCLGQNFFIDLDYLGDLPPCVTFTADLEAQVLPDKSRLDVQWQLARFCDTDDDGRMRLTPGSVARAAADGLAGRALLEALEPMVAGGVPTELRVLVDAAAGSVGQVWLGEAHVLVTASPSDLERLVDLPAVADGLLRVLGGGVALVKPESSAAVRAALGGLGVEVTAELVAPGPEDAAPGRPAPRDPMPRGEVRSVLDQAVRERRQAVIRYDPGARQPVQELRVEPLRVETKNGVGYLHARQTGRTDPRRFSLNFVRSARLLGA